MQPVAFENPLVVLPVGKHQFAEAFLRITNQCPLVILPFLLQVFKVSIVECASNGGRLIVIYFSVAVKLIHEPIPLVGQLMGGVEQLAESVHVIFLPVPFVVAALLIVEPALPISQAVQLLPFVSATIFILLNHVLSVLLFPS